MEPEPRYIFGLDALNESCDDIISLASVLHLFKHLPRATVSVSDTDSDIAFFMSKNADVNYSYRPQRTKDRRALAKYPQEYSQKRV